MNRALAPLVSIVLLTWLHVSAGDLPKPLPVQAPSCFVFGIDNVFGASLKLTLKNGAITCVRTNVDGTKTRRRFALPRLTGIGLSALNKAGVYAWIPHYEKTALDGGGWKVALVVGKNELYSEGLNAYPSDDALYLTSANAGPSHTFEAFWDATCALTSEDKSDFPLK